MYQNDIQRILSDVSYQTGAQMPSAGQIEDFLSSPHSRYIIQSVLSQQSSALNSAVSMVKDGNYTAASSAISEFLNSPDGQNILNLLNGNGDLNG